MMTIIMLQPLQGPSTTSGSTTATIEEIKNDLKEVPDINLNGELRKIYSIKRIIDEPDFDPNAVNSQLTHTTIMIPGE